MRHAWALMLGALFGLLAPYEARAQHDYWEFNVHAGAFAYDLQFDEEDIDDTDVLVGARLARHWENGWGIGLNGDWVFADQIPVPDAEENIEENIDVALILWSAGIDYTFPSAGIANFFVTGGIGGATTRITDIPLPDDEHTQTDLLVPLGIGLKIHNDAEDPSWAIRVDARDNLIWRDDIDVSDQGDVIEGDTEWKNNWELSGGISFFFGGGPAAPPPPTDSDGDGVNDDRDQCPGTPLGTPVDSFGCPVPVDSDGDGVPDDQDQCPETPFGEEVDSDGCPVVVEPEPAAACVDGRDWFRFNETISVDGRNWVKFGSATTIGMDQLVQIGEYDGVPVYVLAEARQPYTEAYLPMCAPADTYQPYQVEEGVRGTTG